jgi:hypothetical protein
MTSLAVQAQAATAVAAVPTPACIRPRRAPVREVPARDQAPVAVAAVGDPVTGGPVTGGPATGGPVTGDPATGDLAGPRRGTARQLLEAALAGVRLGARDRQFLARLVHWDKRNAASVASLLERAQEAGREAGRAEAGQAEAAQAEAAQAEAGLTPRQLELVVAALGDAAVYRASGAAATSCWDCELVPAGRCAEHARDFDRASAYADLASVLSAPASRSAGPRPARELPRDITEYRHRAPVAS